MHCFILLILLSIFTISTSTSVEKKSLKTNLLKKNEFETNIQYKLLKLEKQINDLELNLEFAGYLDQNIKYIDIAWKNNLKYIQNMYKSSNNKEYIVRLLLSNNKYYELEKKYPNDFTNVIDKYSNIIYEITKNENFTNNVFVNMSRYNDIDTNIDIDIKNAIVQFVFTQNDFFSSNSYIVQILKKIKLLESIYNKKFNFDFDFFDNKYVLYYNDYQNFINKIYIFKLQNQLELNKILNIYLVDNYESLQKYILNNMLNLSNEIIEILEK